MNFKLMAAAAAIAVAAPAFAAEPFNGAFVGVEAGWQRDNLNFDLGVDQGSIGLDFAANGFRYGAFIGYDFKANEKFVFGLEAAISDSTGKVTQNDLIDGIAPLVAAEGITRADFAEAFDGVEGQLRTGRTIDVSARAGGLISPNTLLYVRGGYSNARAVLKSGAFSVGGNKDGWLIGAGAETMLGTSLSARIEYRYAQYGSESGSFDLDTGDVLDVSFKPKRHAVTAGVAFRF